MAGTRADRLPNSALLSTILTPFLSARGRAARWPAKGILQQAAEAKGTAINATIGIALDDEGEPLVLGAVARRVSLPPSEIVAYAPGFGLPELRTAWKDGLVKKNPSLRGVAFSLPVVTAGLTHALRIAGELFLDPGEKLVLAAPFWGNYQLIFGGVGAHLDAVPLLTDNIDSGHRLNIDGLRASLAGGSKRAVLFNFPHNPTGYAPTLAEADAIVRLLREAAARGPLVVLLDDAYFGFCYEEGVLRESLFARLASLHENLLAVKVDGASKEEYAWGLRVGFLTFGGKGLAAAEHEALASKSAALVRASVSNAPRLSQRLILDALRDPQHEEEQAEKHALLKRRYEAAKTAVQKHGLAALPFNSGYFLCLRIAGAERARSALLKEGVGVIALPGNLLRIAYSSVAEAKIPELFARIRRVTYAHP